MRNRAHDQYKKVRREGGSIVIAVGKLIPDEWKIVKLTTVGKPTDKSVTIKFDRMV